MDYGDDDDETAPAQLPAPAGGGFDDDDGGAGPGEAELPYDDERKRGDPRRLGDSWADHTAPSSRRLSAATARGKVTTLTTSGTTTMARRRRRREPGPGSTAAPAGSLYCTMTAPAPRAGLLCTYGGAGPGEVGLSFGW